MNEDLQYGQEVARAREEIMDMQERGDAAIGGSWDELRREIFTPEEIAESNMRVALIGEIVKARQELGISQKRLEAMSGVKQPIIARMEKGSTSPQLETVLKVLTPLGKTLQITDLNT